jgi:hypothetical protein
MCRARRYRFFARPTSIQGADAPSPRRRVTRKEGLLARGACKHAGIPAATEP